MKSLAQILSSVQEIAHDFDGCFSLKNADGKYFYVSETWLRYMKLENAAEAMGKNDYELYSKESADFIVKTDRQALESENPMYYESKLTLHGEKFNFMAIKWVVRYKTGEPFCYCMMADSVEKEEKVLEILPKISAIVNQQSLIL